MINTITQYAAVAGIALAMVGGMAAPGFSDEAGEFEYMSACASCHGIDAQGTGPVSEYMSIVVPPLTGLSEANGGVFPMQDIIAMIDGRTDVRGHGSGMPVWGAVYNDPMAAEVSGQSPGFIVRGRILSLAYYLESIQK